MNIAEYKELAELKKFQEHPYIIYAGQTELRHFMDYTNSNLEVKRHLAKIILCRNFSPAGGYQVMSDHKWFISEFLKEYKEDPIRPWLTESVKLSIEMILDKEHFVKHAIGATYMFGVVEFYAKYLLGWRPSITNFHDETFNKLYRDMQIWDAINRLRKIDTELGRAINQIDKQSVGRLKEVGIVERTGVRPRIADRLYEARNPMVHGENHSFSHAGTYLAMIYILFYLHHDNIQSQLIC
ncbi:MAG: hypothetical protein HOP10_02250 [Chitinophagaceae bacterium]|nr:hypothetical protein [Chitinophagaceae bacterium]